MSLAYKIKRRKLTKKVIERNHKIGMWLVENADKISLDDILSIGNRVNRIYRWYLKKNGKRI
jgi:hypothetical protein